MSSIKLGHYSIRTPDLEASRHFYTEVLGLRVGYRPPFDFPGIWLYRDGDESEFGVVHIIGEGAETDAYLGERKASDGGGGHFDHIAFLATGWPELRRRCREHGVPYVERTVPSLRLHQVFLIDPSGITIEMNYPAEEGRA